ncbi:hypothetical protein [Roseiconus lacunae]|uniref:hypothetical protein n=1 Tax=Roseiconus lacunae TaxID=2605694 RepID=UPI0011F2639F|nr:hypothetical protein [Roseiconus lacunae]
MPSAPDEFLLDIRALVNAGKKIEAVKRVRQRERCSLRQALQIVDSIECGESVHLNETPDTLDEHHMDAILDAIDRGNKLEAVKLYRDASGNNLRECKEFVEGLMNRLGTRSAVTSKSGCAGSLLLAAIGLIGTIHWLANSLV